MRVEGKGIPVCVCVRERVKRPRLATPWWVWWWMSWQMGCVGECGGQGGVHSLHGLPGSLRRPLCLLCCLSQCRLGCRLGRLCPQPLKEVLLNAVAGQRDGLAPVSKGASVVPCMGEEQREEGG